MLKNSSLHSEVLSPTRLFFSASLHENEDTENGDDSDEENKYAFKKLKIDLEGETKISGVVDLTIEAQFLYRLSHPHIVKLRGTGGEPGSTDFFIIVDRVQCTLSNAIKTFRRQRETLKLDGICRNGVRLDKKGKAAELRNDFDRRVDIIHQLASALQYLHENS